MLDQLVGQGNRTPALPVLCDTLSQSPCRLRRAVSVVGALAVPQAGVLVVETMGRAPVRVTTLGVEFLWGAEGECEVADFPRLGQSVLLEWQQNSQNFVIIQVE